MRRDLISGSYEIGRLENTDRLKSQQFLTVEYLNDSKNINGTLKNIKHDIKTSDEDGQRPYQLKKHKPWFVKTNRVLYQTKHVKVQWLQNPKQSSADSLNIESREDRRHIKNKTMNI
jgi:hypothetical protein